MSQPRLILFSSSTSTKALQAERLIGEKIPNIKIVRLDTKEQREQVRSGKYFSIYEVPTLIAHHQNGKIDIWKGLDHIVPLFSAPQNQGQDQPQRKPRKSDNMYDNPEGRPRSGRSYEEESYSSEEEPFSEPPPQRRSALKQKHHYEESSEEESPPPPSQKPKKKVRIQEPSGKTLAKKKLEKAKKANGGDHPVPSSVKKGREEANKKLAALRSKKKPSRMKNIMAAAKEQEAALKAVLAD
jgi:hypothetical protein